MKITPLLPAQAGQPSSNLHGSSEVGAPNKVARAKAIAAGEQQIQIMDSDTPQAPKPDVRRITMKTNATVDRYGNTPTSEALEEPLTPVTNSETTAPVVEDTKPLSPQFAALAKQRRALQAKERELADREKALTSQPTQKGVEELTARLKSQPLSVLQEYGVTYDQLTEAILTNQSGSNPEIFALKQEIKALKEGVDKTLSEKDAQTEKQVLTEIRKESERLAKAGDAFELVRVTDSYQDVVDLIHRTYKETGEILDVQEAMQDVENYLVNEAVRIASTGKVKSKIAPATPQQQPQQKQIRTLTNRDTASPVLDRKARAIAAALGTLKR
jgi:hypothetical protein